MKREPGEKVYLLPPCKYEIHVDIQSLIFQINQIKSVYIILFLLPKCISFVQKLLKIVGSFYYQV